LVTAPRGTYEGRLWWQWQGRWQSQWQRAWQEYSLANAAANIMASSMAKGSRRQTCGQKLAASCTAMGCWWQVARQEIRPIFEKILDKLHLISGKV